MRDIRLSHVSKSYRSEHVLEGLNLTIPGGKFFALLGPSGCGKTTILRLIAGFESVDAGKIYLGETDITHTPVHQRRVNTVFQNYALFPHMNVYENIAYGLRVKGMSADEIDQRIRRLSQAFGIERQLHKGITHLSGGQQQRVAVARAVINEPDVLLLDEPLAALDFKLREKMLVELVELQDHLQTTFIYVTHDQFEALTVADQMAIMNQDGEIEQIGTPQEIYEYPRSSFVARFVGSTNIIRGTIMHTATGVVFEARTIPGCSLAVTEPHPWMQHDVSALMSVRPEKIMIAKQKPDDADVCLQGVVDAIVYYGRSTQYTVKLEGGAVLHVFEQNEVHTSRKMIDYDDVVYLYWQSESVVLLER